MTNEKLLEKREKLNSYLGQLIDLEKNKIVGVAITKENVGLLKEVVVMAIATIDLELKKDQDVK